MTDTAPIGLLPHEDSTDASGMDLPKERMSQLLALDGATLLQDAGRALEFLGRFAARLPAQRMGEHRYLVRKSICDRRNERNRQKFEAQCCSRIC